MELYVTQFTILTVTLFLIIIGIIEYHQHLKRLNKIPCRILVNGSRGKSTVTRLIASVLHEAGYTVTARVTGTKAVHILDDGTEIPIKRKNFARITELFETIKLAVKKDSDAIVIECMALVPEYQKIFSDKIVKPNFTIITNVRADHLDVMGPGLTNVAESFASAIYKDSTVISSSGEYGNILKRDAEKKNIKVLTIGAEYYNPIINESTFSFNDNNSIVFALGRTLGIHDEIILKGIKNATKEVGVNFNQKIIVAEKEVDVLNLFSVNDTESTQKLMQEKKLDNNQNIMIYNHRSDRAERAMQFCDFFIKCKKDYNIAGIVFLGEGSYPYIRKLKKAGYPADRIIIKKQLSDIDVFMQETIEQFNPLTNDFSSRMTIIGVGNIRGNGLDIVNYWNKKGVQSA